MLLAVFAMLFVVMEYIFLLFSLVMMEMYWVGTVALPPVQSKQDSTVQQVHLVFAKFACTYAWPVLSPLIVPHAVQWLYGIRLHLPAIWTVHRFPTANFVTIMGLFFV